jgi:YD repeat-containing protein
VRLTGILDANDNQWTYDYSVVGNLTSVQGPGGVTRTWVYSSNNPALLQSETHPESGTVNYTNYDAAGVLKQKTDAKNTVYNYGHDGDDRITSVQAGSEQTTITYESGSNNRLTTNVSGGPSTTFGYDTAGRLASRTDTIDGKSFSTSYVYDANDNLARIVYPSNRHVDYTYNNENQFLSATNPFTQLPYAEGAQYHPSGALSFLRSGNNRTTTIDFNQNRYWVRAINVSPLMSLGYEHDAVGNVTAISDSRPSRSQTFTYDRLHRLQTAESSGYGIMQFAYDVHGNQQSASGVIYTYAANNPFRLSSVSSGPQNMRYDSNGNLQSATGATLTYTASNMLSSFTGPSGSISFAYDGDDWRAKKVVNGGAPTYFVRGANGQLLSEWVNSSPNATVKDYIYAGSRLIAVQTSTSLTPK